MSATANAPAVQQQPQTLTLRQQLESDQFKASIAKVLPKHITPDRMARVAVTALTRTPKLKDCEQISFFRCLMDLSQWGLEPDGRRAHLIPFENRRRGVIECQLIIDYKGLVELCYRSGVTEAIHADVVREGDIFAYSLGQVTEHVPHFLRRDPGKPAEAGDVYAAYCHVKLRGGVTKTEVLSLAEIDGIRKRSRAGNNGPWVTDWNEMAKKTAFRRVSKWLPLSAELRDAVEQDDDSIDAGFIAPARPVSNLNDLTDRLMGAPSNVIDGESSEEGSDEPTGREIKDSNGDVIGTFSESAVDPAMLDRFITCKTPEQIEKCFQANMPKVDNLQALVAARDAALAALPKGEGKQEGKAKKQGSLV